MGQGDVKLCGHEGGRQGRVDVAHHDGPVGPPFQANSFVGHHNAGRLLGVAAAADLETVVRFAQLKIGKKGG